MFRIIRIIAGKNKGYLLKTKEGLSTRPTLDRIRENVFNIIRDNVPGSTFLDLFAGSGAIGLEALSRGAAKATFVELDKFAVRIIKANVAKTDNKELSAILNSDYRKFMKNTTEKYDLIYVDPPYNLVAYKSILEDLGEYGLLKDEGLVVLEAKRDAEVPDETEDLYCCRSVTYGNTIIKLYKKKQEDEL